MNNKVIFFSIDRLGDYLIRSNVIKQISEKFEYSEIVCSEKNYQLISSQPFFSKVVLFNNKFKFLNKLKFILLYILDKYDACIVFDGKNISTLLLFFIRSDYKFVFIYKKKGFINFIFRKSMIFFLKLFKIKYTYLYSRKLIEEKNYDKYPNKYKSLNKHFGNTNNDTYYLDDINNNRYNHLYEKYIIIHLDEKFIDIKNIKTHFNDSLIKLQNNTGKLIFLTSFKNNFDYYHELRFKKVDYTKLEDKEYIHSSISIIEDLPLMHFQNLIKNSYLNISCHSGYFVHTSLAFKKNTIDIINESDEIWLNTWIQKSNNYKIIYKSLIKNEIDVNNILKALKNEINKK